MLCPFHSFKLSIYCVLDLTYYVALHAHEYANIWLRFLQIFMVLPEGISPAIASNFGTHAGPKSVRRSPSVLMRTVITFFLILRTLSFSDYLNFVSEKLTLLPFSPSFNAFSAFVYLFLNHRKVFAVTGSSVSFFNPA